MKTLNNTTQRSIYSLNLYENTQKIILRYFLKHVIINKNVGTVHQLIEILRKYAINRDTVSISNFATYTISNNIEEIKLNTC